MGNFVHRVTRENLALEHMSKVARDPVGRSGKAYIPGARGLLLERRDPTIRDPTRDNPVEVAQVGRDIQRKAMRRDRL